MSLGLELGRLTSEEIDILEGLLSGLEIVIFQLEAVLAHLENINILFFDRNA